MELNLPEDYGYITVRTADGSSLQLDLFKINERLASIGIQFEDKPSWEYLEKIQELLTELGLPAVSGYVANAFVDGIGKAMGELKKKGTAGQPPSSPDSTAPTP